MNATPMTLTMGGNRAGWKADGGSFSSFFGSPRPVAEHPACRFHWFDDCSETSICENYRQFFFALNWSERHEFCPRCVEALRFAGREFPPYPTPKAPSTAPPARLGRGKKR